MDQKFTAQAARLRRKHRQMPNHDIGRPRNRPAPVLHPSRVGTNAKMQCFNRFDGLDTCLLAPEERKSKAPTQKGNSAGGAGAMHLGKPDPPQLTTEERNTKSQAGRVNSAGGTGVEHLGETNPRLSTTEERNPKA